MRQTHGLDTMVSLDVEFFCPEAILINYPDNTSHDIIDNKISKKAKEIIIILTISNNGKKKFQHSVFCIFFLFIFYLFLKIEYLSKKMRVNEINNKIAKKKKN